MAQMLGGSRLTAELICIAPAGRATMPSRTWASFIRNKSGAIAPISIKHHNAPGNTVYLSEPINGNTNC